MRLGRGILFGVIAGVIIVVISLVFFFNVFNIDATKSLNIFYFVFGLGALTILLPFVINSIINTKSEREKEEMFLEFSRSLVESVNSGTPISKSIVNLKDKNFGTLSPHIEKLANQIELGIPIKDALETFAYDTKSKTIIRAITLIREAENTGGSINNILESVATSVSEIEKLRSERRAAISSIVVEGYIIFLVFIVIMIVMQVQIIPMTSQIASISAGASIPGTPSLGIGGQAVDPQQFSNAFLGLLVSQGLFAGLIIGKLSEGNIKAGIKHSFIMVAMAVLISTGANIFLR